ncbi:MAG: carbohydrate porin [Candidatus Brocadiales bacterium]
MLNSILFVDLESIGGSGPDIFSNTVSGLNDDVSRGSHQDDDGLDRVSVREVWLQSMLMEDRLRLVAGKIDLTNYFDMNTVANDETTQFLASAFVNNLALSPPDNGPGVVGYFDTRKGYSFGAGLQSSDNSGTAVTDRVFAIGELDYHTPKFLFGREGDYRFWGRYNGDTRSSAVGVSFDQKFREGLSGFGRFGATHNAAPDEVKWTWSLGLGLSSPFSLRRNDHAGLAFSRLKTDESKNEELAEVYYNFFITDHMSATLNSQVLLNSIREESFKEDYLSTFGLRVQMDF